MEQVGDLRDGLWPAPLPDPIGIAPRQGVPVRWLVKAKRTRSIKSTLSVSVHLCPWAGLQSWAAVLCFSIVAVVFDPL